MALELLLLGLLAGRLIDPAFLRGQLLPCLVLGLAPGCVMRLLGRSSLAAHRVGVSVGLMTFMFTNHMLDLSAVEHVLERWDLLAVGLSLICLQPVFHMLRWGTLLAGQEVSLSYTECLRLILVGCFFNTFVPGATGGDIFRAYCVARSRQETEAAVTSVVLDRLIGLPPLVMILAMASVVNWPFLTSMPGLKTFAWILGVAVLVVCLIFGVLIWISARAGAASAAWERRVPGGRVLSRFRRALAAYQSRWGCLAIAFSVSLASHLCTIAAAILFGRAAGVTGISGVLFFLLVPVGLAINAVPLAPGGLGQGEVAFSRLFAAAASGNGPRGVAVMVCLRLGLILTGLAGGVLYALGRHRIDTAREQAEGEVLEAEVVAVQGMGAHERT